MCVPCMFLIDVGLGVRVLTFAWLVLIRSASVQGVTEMAALLVALQTIRDDRDLGESVRGRYIHVRLDNLEDVRILTSLRIGQLRTISFLGLS